MSGRPLVLLQTSDARAGAPLVSPGVGWTPELREAVHEERAGALARAVAAAQEAGAEVLLLPGNLWDADTSAVGQLRRQLDALAGFHGTVLVAPGPLDAPSRLPVGDASLRAALGLGEWPANVHLFASGVFTTFVPPGREDVAFVGRAHDGAISAPPAAPARLSVLVASAGSEPEPLEVPEGYAWGAFGGSEEAREIRAGDALRGAFAGCPAPASFGGEGGGAPAFLLVTLVAGEPPAVRRLPSTGLRFVDLALSVDGLDDGAILAAAALRLEEAGAGAGDAVRLTLSGTPHPAARLSLGPLASRVRHLAVRDHTERPSANEDPRSAEGRFVSEMRERVARAAAPAEARRPRLALELGRAALAARPLVPPGREDA